MRAGFEMHGWAVQGLLLILLALGYAVLAVTMVCCFPLRVYRLGFSSAVEAYQKTWVALATWCRQGRPRRRL